MKSHSSQIAVQEVPGRTKAVAPNDCKGVMSAPKNENISSGLLVPDTVVTQ